jgi:hypothetical protein
VTYKNVSEEPSETTEKVPSFPNQLLFWGTEMYNEAKKDPYKPFKWLSVFGLFTKFLDTDFFSGFEPSR